MITEPVKYHKEEMEYFWNMIAERYRIRIKKEVEGLEPPWTEDPIFNEFKFTNVKRWHDRGTRFVTEYILPKPMHRLDKLFNLIIYRIFNKIETYLILGCQTLNTYSKKYTLGELEAIEEFGNFKVFTNAFLVSGYSQFGSGMAKIERVSILLDQVRNTIQRDNKSGSLNRVWQCNTGEEAYDWLRTVNGVGPFLGYQMMVDLSYWNETQFGEDDFVVAGPGAKRGLQELFPEEEIKKHKYEPLNFWLRDKQFSFWEDYNINPRKVFSDIRIPYLTVMDLENCLCEFSKYMKAKRGDGRPRNKYNTHQGYTYDYPTRDDNWVPSEWTFDVFDNEQNTKQYTSLTGESVWSINR